jgi:hypothetical protein
MGRCSMATCNHYRKSCPCGSIRGTGDGRFLGGPRPFPHRCLAQILRWSGLASPSMVFGCMNLLYALHDCAFCLVFHLYSNVCPTNHVFSNTSGTRSIVKAYVSKDCLFLPFWTLIGGQI